MEQPCKHEPVCAFGLAERQAVDPKNFQCRVQELERVAFSAIAPPCHVYPDLVLYRPTGLPLCQKLMTDPAGSLTQGAVLKVSANGTVTSPVVRGAYVLDRFLGTPPEPPPKNVPAIEPDIRGATTIRAQLEKHRSDAACAGCHAKMDPPGFALESYDVTGRWRSHYRILSEENREKIVTLPGAPYRLFVQGPAVQPEATMADGFQFDDVEGFKRHLLANPKVLARCLVQKLTVHLTGASLQFADREVVEAILKDAESDGYGIRSLIHGIVQSRMFTHK
jgi:hypothetical protein